MDLRLVFSLCVFIFYCVNCPVIVVRMSSPNFPQLKPNFKFINNSYLYMTTWNLVFIVVYYFLSVAVHFVPFRKQKHKKQFETFLDYSFVTVGFPFSLIVATLFWIFFNNDRELIFPSSIDEHLHPWYNHVMHTTILVNSALELVLFRHKMPPRTAFYVMDFIIVSYVSIVHIHYLLTDIWPYGFFFHFTWFHHVLLYLFSFTLIRATQFIAIQWIKRQDKANLDSVAQREEMKLK